MNVNLLKFKRAITIGRFMKDIFTVLVFSKSREDQLAIESVLKSLKYRVILASTTQEARLKFTNEEYNMLILDMGDEYKQTLDFIKYVKDKEGRKNVKATLPMLVTGNQSEIFTEKFSMLDNVKFLSSPYSLADLKKKLLTFSGKADNIQKNSRTIAAGEYLITEGGTSHEMYWVLSGEFIITKMNKDDNNVILGHVLPGELVGEMSFLDNLPRSASVRAQADSEVLAIPHNKFLDVLDGQPRWFRSLMQTMSHRLRDANTKIVKKID